MSAPPDKENARPGGPETGGFGKQVDDSTFDIAAQAMIECVLGCVWQDVSPQIRRTFLDEIRKEMPELWRLIAEAHSRTEDKE